jgi:hypothetical protein
MQHVGCAWSSSLMASLRPPSSLLWHERRVGGNTTAAYEHGRVTEAVDKTHVLSLFWKAQLESAMIARPKERLVTFNVTSVFQAQDAVLAHMLSTGRAHRLVMTDSDLLTLGSNRHFGSEYS